MKWETPEEQFDRHARWSLYLVRSMAIVIWVSIFLWFVGLIP